MSRTTVAAGVLVGLVLGGGSVAGAVWQTSRDDTSERCVEAVATADRLIAESKVRGPGQTPLPDAEIRALGRRFTSVILTEPACFSVKDVADARAAERSLDQQEQDN